MEIHNTTIHKKPILEKVVLPLPNLQEENFTIVEIEEQNTESNENTAIVLAKEKKNKAQMPIWNTVHSLFYALQWSQFKRQLTKEALSAMGKRHWGKATVGTTAMVALMTWNSQNNNNLPSYQVAQTTLPASVAISILPQENIVLSEAAKENYITRFSAVAKGEMQKFGIPASVILGLAILHSNYGASELAQAGNNHFHIACDENHLAEGISGRGTYDNQCYTHYQNAWTSFRANSLQLNAEAFQELKKIAKNDYKIWVSGLQKMNHPQSEELLNIIEKHKLYSIDN